MALGDLSVRVLGTVECRLAGDPLPLGGARRSALLALLALRAPHAVARAELMDGLWGDHPPPTAANSLQVHVSALRRALGYEVIRTRGDGYRLAEDVAVDVRDFAAAVQRGHELRAAGELESAARALSGALAMWRGPALADVIDAPFAAPAATRLSELHTSALCARVDMDLQLGRHQDVVPELTALVAERPLHEGLRERLMRALYFGDRQAEALAVYDAGRRLLRDELGLDPSESLRAMQQRILAHAADGPSQQPAHLTQLPLLLGVTVGRATEVAELRQLVSSGARLVTVLGAGGVGKTRLAIETARRFAGSFRDGVVFVPLAEAEKPADVPATICAALGLVAAAERPMATLVAALQVRETLLVCDNFEHVLDAGWLLAEVLQAAPGVQVVVTSRAPLGLHGESRFQLEPLAAYAVDGTAPAVELFLTRAREADPRFKPEAEEWPYVADICQRCDGLPLAIELAAARTRALTLAELDERLARPLALLHSFTTDSPDRQRTMRTCIAWSVDGIPELARSFLAQLTVFRGGFTLDGAAAVTGRSPDQTLRHVETLLDHNLIRRSRTPQGSHRFALLETVRQFAAELLDPDDEMSALARHARFYRDLLDPAPDCSPTPSRADEWIAQLAERPNIRAAIRHSLDHSRDALAADLVAGAATMWLAIGPRNELADWLTALLDSAKLPRGRRVDLLYTKAFLHERAGDLAGVRETLLEGQRLAAMLDDERRMAWLLYFTAHAAVLGGDRVDAQRCSAQATTIVARHDEADELQAWSLLAQGLVAPTPQLAVRHMEAGLRFTRGRGLDVTGLLLLGNLIENLLIAGDPERASALADEGVKQAATLQMDELASVQHCLRGHAHVLLGRVEQARDDAIGGLRLAVRLGIAVIGLHNMQVLAAALAPSWPKRSAELVGVLAADPTPAERQAQRQIRERFLADLPERLGDAYAPARARGAALVERHGTLGALAIVARDPYGETQAAARTRMP